jgi:hypothetical protein
MADHIERHQMNTQTINQQLQLPRRLVPLLGGFALGAVVLTSPVARAQDLIVDSFPNAQTVMQGNDPGLDWANYRGENVTVTWDPNQQSPGNPNPGAMYVSVNWPAVTDPAYTTAWTDIQFAFSTGGSFASSNYIQFDCDIKVDVTNSSLAIDGSDYGAIELIVNNPWNNVVGWAQLIDTNGWQHFTGFFSALPGGDYNEAIVGLISQGTDTLTNTVDYWIDNVRFTAVPTVNTNQPPLAIAKAPPPGLTCICSQGGGTYQRQMIRSANSTYSWNTSSGAGNTTSYSMTIASYPASTYAGFEDQMFLIPQSGMIGAPQDDNIDWDSSDVVDMEVGFGPGNTAVGTFQYKVNQSSSWNASLIVTLPCTSGPLGTWTLTFNDNTNITMTAPNGASTNFTMNSSDAAIFQNPLFIYLGDQPNFNANIGQSSTFSHFTTSGAVGTINDNFISYQPAGRPYTLDPGIWADDTAADTTGIVVSAPDAKYWITWPIPDGGFTNVYATDNLSNRLGNFQWKALPASATGWELVAGVQRLSVINQSTLNAAFGYQPTNCFFGLFHQ